MPLELVAGGESGYHNANIEQTAKRLFDSGAWRDLSHIIVTPTSEDISARIVFSWMGLIKPPNNKSIHRGTIDCEVGQAYSLFVESVLGDPGLRDWKYLITLEHDNSPPADGIVKLLNQMEMHPEFAAIGGLYFTKGYGGVAQIWGDPSDPQLNFRPLPPDPNGGLVPCNGTGMGFTCFRLSMFKDPFLRRPWFKTAASQQEGGWTQDLYFWSDAWRLGYKAAVDCSIKVGHWDKENKFMW